MLGGLGGRPLTAKGHSERGASGGSWRRRWPLLIVGAAMVFHVACALTLMPTAGQPYDIAALTGASDAWLRWGFPLLYNWKFGLDLSAMGVGAQGLRFLLEQLGMSGAAALAAAWKVPLVLSDLLVGACLLDLGFLLKVRRPALVPTLWLLSPVSLWVSAGHGQVEPLTILSFVLSMDLLFRRQPFFAGVVVGLGIGMEFLPAGIVLVVGLCLYTAVIRRQEALRFLLGLILATELCFEASFVSNVGRESLLAGLGFTVTVTTHSGHGIGPAAAGSSLWSIVGLNPGKVWLLVLILAGGALLSVLAVKSRRLAGMAERRRLAMIGAGGLLLAIVLLDPGALPQFADLSLGALCLIALGVELSPMAIIVGPLLQLAAGLLFVYGGDFQSYWYDMWVKTGNAGWPFPESLPAANAAALLGAVVVLGALVLAALHAAAPITRKVRVPLLPIAIAIAMVGSMFLAVWSYQPAYWQGVGSHGPTSLADFQFLSATRQGTVSSSPAGTTVQFRPVLSAAAREATVPPALVLTARARPLYSVTQAVVPVPGDTAQQSVTIPNWQRLHQDVRSVWVSIVVGRKNWNSADAAATGQPNLVAGVVDIHPASDQWLVPGWALMSFTVPASQISPAGVLPLSLQDTDPSDSELVWNGTSTKRWILVELHQGQASLTIDGATQTQSVNLEPPSAGAYLNEQGVVVAAEPKAKILITRAVLGGEPAKVIGGAFGWPLNAPLDRTIPAPGLDIMGALDFLLLLGGTLALMGYLRRLRSEAAEEKAFSPPRSRPFEVAWLPSRVDLSAVRRWVKHLTPGHAAVVAVPREGRPVLVMTTRYPVGFPGGAEIFADGLAEHLETSAAGSWKVIRVSAFRHDRGISRVPLIGEVFASLRLALLTIRPTDAILVHGAKYAWGPMVVGRLTHRPVVVVWSEVQVLEPRPPSRGLLHRVARTLELGLDDRLQRVALHATAGIAVSSLLERAVRSHFNFTGPLTVVGNAAVGRGGAPGSPGGGRTGERRRGLELRVIWIGTSPYLKGLDVALGACSAARSRGVDLTLTVAGVGRGEHPVAGRFALEPWVSWLGRVSPAEVERLLQQHDVLLLPARSEGYGLAVLEALGQRLPVIGSQLVGWLIEDAGEVVLGDDPDGYAEALARMADPRYRLRLSGLAARRAEHFAWAVTGAGYAAVLESVIGTPLMPIRPIASNPPPTAPPDGPGA